MVNFGQRQSNNNETILLPQAKTSGDISLEEAILKRRSHRNFTNKPLTLDQVSQILWSAQGVTDKKKGHRSTPSAGAAYPLEIYIVIGKNKVKGLKTGVYHYLPFNHSLVCLKDKDISIRLMLACYGQFWVKTAAVNLIISADYKKVTRKYCQRGIKYAYIEVGHVGQNVCLQAESLGLETVTIGAFSDNKVKKVLGIDEEPLYIMPIGATAKNAK